MISLLAVAVLIASPATLSAPGSCPSETAVQAALARIGIVNVANATVTIDEIPDGMIVTGQVGGADRSRRIVTGSNCDERAQMVAVVIASWNRSANPISVDDQASREAVAGGFSQSATQREKAVSRSWAGIGLAGGFDKLDATFALQPQVEVKLKMPRLSIRTTLHVPLFRRLHLSNGNAGWFSPGLGVCGAWRPTSTFSIDMGAIAMWTLAWGDGFDSDKVAAQMQLGGTVGIRMELRSWLDGAWVDVRSAVIPSRVSLQVQQNNETVASETVPQWSVLLGLGMAWSL